MYRNTNKFVTNILNISRFYDAQMKNKRKKKYKKNERNPIAKKCPNIDIEISLNTQNSDIFVHTFLFIQSLAVCFFLFYFIVTNSLGRILL